MDQFEEKSSRVASRKFLQDFDQFAKRFDSVADADSFQGPLLEQLAKELTQVHSVELSQLAKSVYTGAYPNCSFSETLDEDLRIIRDRRWSLVDSSQEAKLLGELYWRACRGCYLRITLNKSRHGLEEDRGEAVHLARLALRYDSSNFLVCYWYMIALGWQLDATSSPREKTLVSRCFMESTLRCIEMNPLDRLAHHLLGRYYFNVAHLSWLERTLANKALGCKLEGTFADAEREFLTAHQASEWLPTGLWMARVKLAQKAPLDEVKKWIDFGLRLECKEPTSEIERRQLIELKAELKLCN